MEKNDSINVIRTAIDKGRPSTTDIVPGTVLHHFLYKSRANVQFTMSTYDPDFSSISRRRRFALIPLSFTILNQYHPTTNIHPTIQTPFNIQQPTRQHPRQTHTRQSPPLRLPIGQFVRLGYPGLRALLRRGTECQSQCACSECE